MHHTACFHDSAVKSTSLGVDCSRYIPAHVGLRCSVRPVGLRARHRQLSRSAALSQKPSGSALQHQQHALRTQAAAQETLVLNDPSIEFLGVLNDGMQTVKGVLHVAADVDLVYSILTDYDSCARVFRNIAGTETVYTPTGGKQVVQACRWNFLALSGTFNVCLNVVEEPASRLLVFRLQSSSFMKDFEGRWQVEQAAAGGCRIEHVLAVKPLLAIPAAIAPYTSSIFKEQVAALLQDLNREICRQVAEQAATN